MVYNVNIWDGRRIIIYRLAGNSTPFIYQKHYKKELKWDLRIFCQKMNWDSENNGVVPNARNCQKQTLVLNNIFVYNIPPMEGIL